MRVKSLRRKNCLRQDSLVAGRIVGPLAQNADMSDTTPAGLLVLTLGGQKIRAIARFHIDELYPRFGLPESLPEPGPVAFTEYSSGTCGRPSGM